MTILQQLINGGAASSSDSEIFTRIDPVTAEIATEAYAATESDINEAISAAEDAFRSWGSTTPQQRRVLLNAAANEMETRISDFTELMLKETGATRPWAEFNVRLGASILRESAAMVTQLTGEVIPSNKPGTIAMTIPKPKGVCLGIAPWNAPVILGVRAIAMPVACGNTVVLKASEICPATHRLIGECFVKAGFPAGVINVLINQPKDAARVVKKLVESKAVRHVNFTGSTEVGRIIGRLAGENLKPALLELGGKAPLVVLDDADLDGAVNAAIFGCFMNQGQICMSTERLIVSEGIADEFVQKLSSRASNLLYGDPRTQVALGALIDESATQKMKSLILDAQEKGAQLVAGGESISVLHSPTLLDHVNSKMRIYREESFGPVKSIIRVSSDEEAIDIANDTEYGLSAAVFSMNIKRALNVANSIQSGICHINGPTLADEPQMPFGGVKDSGYGRFGGKAAIAEFTDLRWITIEDPDQVYPF